MEFESIYRNTAELILQLDRVEKGIKKIKCNTDAELKMKNSILESFSYGVNSLFISVDLMNEVIENKDDITGMETVGDILANNEPVN